MNAIWNLPPPPDFRGLRDDLPLHLYEQHLPHWRQDGATYFVTFRLHDSLPQAKLRELKLFRAEWERRHPPPHSREDREDLSREVMRRVEAWLDQGMGSCVLKSSDVSAMVVEAVHCDDGRAYELDCYVIVPNHAHAIVRPLVPVRLPLEKILQHWKGASSCKMNSHLRRSGMLWQRESFDRIIRDEEHLWRAMQYIGRHPQNAGLLAEAVPLWLRPEWIALGWRFAPP